MKTIDEVIVLLLDPTTPGTPELDNEIAILLNSDPEQFKKLMLENDPRNSLLIIAVKKDLFNLIKQIGIWDKNQEINLDDIDLRHAIRILETKNKATASAFQQAFTHRNLAPENTPEDFEKMKPQYRAKLEQLPDPDIRDLGLTLVSELQPIQDMSDPKKSTHAWTFKSGEDAVKDGSAKEINITFLGTGSEPLFADHDFGMRKGGDTLCHLALEKATVEKQPSLLVRGVGTHLTTRSEYPLQAFFDKNQPTSGGVGGGALGKGIDRRIKLALEEFYIPTLIRMINEELRKNPEGKLEDIKVNIVGHSRGAITSYYMASLIDSWINHVKQANLSDNQLGEIARMYGIEPSAFTQAIRALKEERIDCKMNMLLYDPVEGKFRSGSAQTKGDPTIYINVKGFNQPLNSTCSQMPKRVTQSTLFLSECERRMDFRPTIATFEPGTQQKYMIQLGTHSTMTGNLGDDTGNGPYSYAAYRNPDPEKTTLAKQLGNAMIDRSILDARTSLFSNQLPPLPRDLLNRIMNAGDKDIPKVSYPLARNYLLSKLKVSEDRAFSPEDINTSINNYYQARERAPEMDKRLQYLLKKDIHELYCHADPSVVAKLMQDMKEDTTHTKIWIPSYGEKDLPLALQSASETRQIFLRKQGNATGHMLEMNIRFNELRTPSKFDPTPAYWIPNGQHSLLDPFYGEVITMDPQSEDFEKQIDMNMAYDELCQMLVTCKQSNFNQDDAFERVLPYVKQFEDKINALNLSDDEKNKYISYVLLKAGFQYKVLNEEQLNRLIGQRYTQAFNYAKVSIIDPVKKFLIEQYTKELSIHPELRRTLNDIQQKPEWTLSDAYDHCIQLLQTSFFDIIGTSDFKREPKPKNDFDLIQKIEELMFLSNGFKVYNLIRNRTREVKDPSRKKVMNVILEVTKDRIISGQNVLDLNMIIHEASKRWLQSNKPMSEFLRGIEEVSSGYIRVTDNRSNFKIMYDDIQTERANLGLEKQDLKEVRSLLVEAEFLHMIENLYQELLTNENVSHQVILEILLVAQDKHNRGEHILDINELILEALENWKDMGKDAQLFEDAVAEYKPGLSLGILKDSRTPFKLMFDKMQEERKKVGLEQQNLSDIKTEIVRLYPPKDQSQSVATDKRMWSLPWRAANTQTAANPDSQAVKEPHSKPKP